MRIKKLIAKIREANPSVKKGALLLFANFENNKYTFRQESSFYYLTGIKEPGVVFVIYFDGDSLEEKELQTQLFCPNYGMDRDQWVEKGLKQDSPVEVVKLGAKCRGYCMSPFFSKEEHEGLISELNKFLGSDGTLFGLLDKSNPSYFTSFYRMEKLLGCPAASRMRVGHGDSKVVDVSPLVASMRRSKDKHEIEALSRAIDVTYLAHKKVSEIIRSGLYEYEIQAEVESVFTKNGASIAFPSIVATGKNTTILHYTARNQQLVDGDLVVVDIGAEYENYCADITRTFSVSGRFSRRQSEVYKIVLELQELIASLAKPGMFLSNKDFPEMSLHHIAVVELAERGYDKYFVHGIGHFLGLDVHDVGDLSVPLMEGDVFTIEPGIYIAEENIGVRIEDDFLIEEGRCRRLGQNLL